MNDEAFCWLTTTGRRTGRPHEIEIWFARHGRTLYILAGAGERADFVRNLRAEPRVTVRVGGETHEATARVVDDPPEAALARRLVPEKYAAEEEGLDEWAEEALPVAVDLG